MSKDLLRNGEVIAGALLAALGVYIFLQSRAWDYYTPDGPGPGFFPTWYGVAMVVLSLGLVLSHVAKHARGEAAEARTIDWQAAGRALATWLAFAVSVALMDTLGFAISFALMTFFVVAVVFRRPPMTAGLTAIGAALAFHVIFPVILNVPLPAGVLGF
jgi:putative tricarboxylic transport membrane protein